MPRADAASHNRRDQQQGHGHRDAMAAGGRHLALRSRTACGPARMTVGGGHWAVTVRRRARAFDDLLDRLVGHIAVSFRRPRRL